MCWQSLRCTEQYGRPVGRHKGDQYLEIRCGRNDPSPKGYLDIFAFQHIKLLILHECAAIVGESANPSGEDR
jgi:hypothetical protein